MKFFKNMLNNANNKQETPHYHMTMKIHDFLVDIT